MTPADFPSAIKHAPIFTINGRLYERCPAAAMLKIDADQWKALTDAQRAALVDHELTHLELKKDGDGVTKTDDFDRPKLMIKRHDVEIGWFGDVVRRHERDALEYQALDSLNRSVAQMQLPFMQLVG